MYLYRLTSHNNICHLFTVIATLENIEFLDGAPIEKSERIQAIQNLEKIRPIILKQELEYLEKRQDEKLSNLIEVRDKAKGAVHVLLSRYYPKLIQILSKLYPDFIQILSKFYPDFLETHFILILSRFYSNF